MPMRKCRWLHMALVALCFAAPAPSWALGLGEIKVESALNERFIGRIDVSDVQDYGKSEIVVSMASRQDFERVGVERFFYLTYLEFEVEVALDGRVHVNVTSSQAISEPYLNFIVEVMWPKGRLLKEYTVLLDPPTYTELAAPSVTVPQQPVAVAPARPVEPKPAAADRGTRVRVAPASAPARRSGRMDNTDRVRTTRQDTLWKIANRTLASDRVTVYQQMLALQRKNPRAFIRANINLLKAGHVLEIPTESEAMEMSHAMALADVAEQTAAWRENRPVRRESPAQPEALAAATEQPEVQLASQVDATPERRESRASADENTGRVRILANTGDAGSGTSTGADVGVSQLIEEKEVLSRQVEELNYQLDREKEIAANQVSVKDRRLEVKNQEIAQLEEQLRQQREMLEQLQSNQNQNQNPNASEIPWWMSPLVMFGAIGVLILILVLALISARRSRAALATVTASPINAPIESNPVFAASAGAMDAAEDEEAEDFQDDDEVDTGPLEPTIGDDDDLDLDILDIEEDAPLEEGAAGASNRSGEIGDMIGEAEIYIAYGRFGQAVNLLSGVLEQEAERHDVRLKLLEVFVESNDEAGFEAHAQYLADNCDDADILQAYQQLEDQLREGVIDLSREDGEDVADTGMSETETEPPDGGDLTLGDLEDFEPASTDSAIDEPASADETAMEDAEDEFELEFEGDIEAALDESNSSGSADLGGELGMDFDPERDVDEDILAAGEDVEPVSDESIVLESEPLDLDDLVSELDDVSVEQGDAHNEAPSGDESAAEAEDEVTVDLGSASGGEDNEFDFDTGADADINATKLDLAEAYIDMGDADGAQEILKEVVEEGTPEQRTKAQEMLDGIA